MARQYPQIRHDEYSKCVRHKVKVCGTITIHLVMCESRTSVNFVVLNELIVPVLIGTAYIDRFIKLLPLLERKIVPHHFPPVPNLMVYEAPGKAEHNKYNIRKTV